MRLRIKAEFAEAAADLFSKAGFDPIYVDRTAELGPSFWFEKLPCEEEGRLVETIPGKSTRCERYL